MTLAANGELLKFVSLPWWWFYCCSLASVTTSGKGKMLEILPHLQKQSEYHRKMVYNMHLKIEAKRCRSSRDNWELRTCGNYEHLVDNSISFLNIVFFPDMLFWNVTYFKFKFLILLYSGYREKVGSSVCSTSHLQSRHHLLQVSVCFIASMHRNIAWG